MINLILTFILACGAQPDVRVPFQNLAETASTPCEKPSQYIIQGTPAPCTGHLFSPELARKLKFQDETYTDLELLVEHQRNTISVLNDRVNESQKYANELYMDIERNQRYDFWEKTLFFAFGVIVTGAIVSAVK